jgi:hypothetical protein
LRREASWTSCPRPRPRVELLDWFSEVFSLRNPLVRVRGAVNLNPMECSFACCYVTFSCCAMGTREMLHSFLWKCWCTVSLSGLVLYINIPEMCVTLLIVYDILVEFFLFCCVWAGCFLMFNWTSAVRTARRRSADWSA